MSRVDYTEAWAELIRELGAKPHWGTKELHVLMANVTARCTIDEELYGQAVRRLGEHVVDTALGIVREQEDRSPDHAGPLEAGAMVEDPHLQSPERNGGSQHGVDTREPAGAR